MARGEVRRTCTLASGPWRPLEALEGAGGRRRPPSDVKSLMLRPQDLTEPPPAELDRHVGVMLHPRSTHPGIGPLELPGQWRPVTVQHLQETGARLRKYKRKYNKLRGVVPECPTISKSSSSDSKESLQAKQRRKQRNKMKRARRQAQKAAEKKLWEQQQQDLLKQIAQVQAAQAAQAAEPPVQPPAPVQLPQIANRQEHKLSNPISATSREDKSSHPRSPTSQKHKPSQPRSPTSQEHRRKNRDRPCSHQARRANASGRLWKDPKVCLGGELQCLGNEMCAGCTPGTPQTPQTVLVDSG